MNANAIATNTSTDFAPGPPSGRFALLTDRPDELDGLAGALRQYASGGVREVFAWTGVERFRAPSGTHPPYRGLARVEARKITAERVADAESRAQALVRSWSASSWPTHTEVILDACIDTIASRLQINRIELLITPGRNGMEGLARAAAARAGCALLLVPLKADADAVDHRSGWLFGKRHASTGRLGAFHG
jgi:hypothetical protein